MICGNTALLIPFLATGYLLSIYLLLSLAQRQVKNVEGRR
jgi:hypothetical protein